MKSKKALALVTAGAAISLASSLAAASDVNTLNAMEEAKKVAQAKSLLDVLGTVNVIVTTPEGTDPDES